MAQEAQELRKKNAEMKKEEAEAMYQMSRAFGQRDAFPSNKMRKVIDAGGNEGGYIFELVNPWYQSQPVGTIKSIQVTINGETVSQDDTYFVFREQMIPSKLAKTFFEFWWGFGEAAEIYIKKTKETAGMIKAKNEVVVIIDMATLMMDDASMIFDMKNTMEVI